MPVLKIRNEAGEEIEIPAIRGKTAYEYARDGGYEGTEEEFGEALALMLSGVSGGPSVRIGQITLLASAWSGINDTYSQVVNIEGVTENSKVDLTPSAEQLAEFKKNKLALLTENDGGIVTVYALGEKPPQNDYTIQVTITEVDYE